MGARQDTDFASDGADLVKFSSVDTDAFIGDEISHEVVFEVFVGGGDFGLSIGEGLGGFGEDLFFEVVEGGVSLEFCGDCHRGHGFFGILRERICDILCDGGGLELSF